MTSAPPNPRAITFIDGQNLFNAAKQAFGYKFPNYDVVKLSQELCTSRGWTLAQVRFYTGLPEPSDPRHAFWANKLAAFGRQGVVSYSRPLRYRYEDIVRANGTTEHVRVPTEKGIDIRLALDVIRLAYSDRLDVALIFSQDQDYSEVAREIRAMSRGMSRWMKVASAFPDSDASANKRGINDTDWIPISRVTYDLCIDPADYRPPK